ncbi:hypothetical protein AB0C95_27020 [Streptomyces caniferus]|uniref:hypothetical protein n=1 Tax=Streptomyces caniferus TaxID=285557 RepID=UPI0033C6F3B7
MDERGQETVDEHQPVLRTGAHGSLPRPGGQPGLMPFLPQRTYFGQEFSDRFDRQARDRRSLMIAARFAFPTTPP